MRLPSSRPTARTMTMLANSIYSGVPSHFFGMEQVIEVGPMSGKSNVQFWLERHGIPRTRNWSTASSQRAKESNRMLTDAEIMECGARRQRCAVGAGVVSGSVLSVPGFVERFVAGHACEVVPSARLLKVAARIEAAAAFTALLLPSPPYYHWNILMGPSPPARTSSGQASESQRSRSAQQQVARVAELRPCSRSLRLVSLACS